MCSLEKRIRDLIHFYVKENYNHYLQVNQISSILESDIPNVVEMLYDQKKEHIQNSFSEAVFWFQKFSHTFE